MTVFRELSQHILDIAENSANAGASLLNLEIEEDLNADRLTISLQDNGSGMEPEMLKYIADPWVTSRTTRNVGLGIPFLKQTAEMCDGHFEIASELGAGTRVSATFGHSHIDRPPLGDLIGTLLCIIIGYPEEDLFYRHKVNGQIFTLDTREIREILGDSVPFSDPEVIGFLRRSLEDGIKALGGEPLPDL